MTTYIEAIARRDTDWEKFDPKAKQKVIYMWYDRKYSDDALDIYSKEWHERIRAWNKTWVEAHQLAIDKSNEALTIDELLESLDFGIFFLAHPIAAFSLWRVLQASYELDRAVCGDTTQVTLWEDMPPFRYLKDQGIQQKWNSEIEQLKEQMKRPSSRFGKQSSKFRMYEILAGVERYEHAVTSMKENFAYNGEGKEFASWMTERIEEGFERRLTVIELLNFQDNELRSIHHMPSHGAAIGGETTGEFLLTAAAWLLTIKAKPAPEYERTETLPVYSSPLEQVSKKNDAPARDTAPG